MISWRIRTTRAVLVWVVIELNLLLFLPLLVFRSNLFRGVSGLKFFFIQSVGGIILLLCILSISSSPRENLLIVSRLRILLKIGGFPFHQWLLSLSTDLGWDGLLILLTIQKAIPLYILSAFNRRALVPLMAFSWIALRVRGLAIKQVKKIFVLSSVFFLGALVLSTVLGGWGWKPLLFLYFGVFASFAVLAGGEKGPSRGAPGSNSIQASRGWLLVILLLRGIPPFPAFWMKVEVVRGVMVMQEPVQAIIFILCGGVFIYIYVSLISWFLLLRVRLKVSHIKNKLGAMWSVIPVLLMWTLL